MKDFEKPKKKPKKLYDRDKAHVITDIMISFIGVSMIILALLSLTGKIPKEYAFGATLAGFCFVYADIFLVEEKISLKGLWIYGISLFLGVLSFILLPVLLLVNSNLGDTLMSNTDFFTFMAFGIVLMTMGFKTLVRRHEQQEKTSNELKEIREELNTIMKKNDEISRGIEREMENLKEAMSIALEK